MESPQLILLVGGFVVLLVGLATWRDTSRRRRSEDGHASPRAKQQTLGGGSLIAIAALDSTGVPFWVIVVAGLALIGSASR